MKKFIFLFSLLALVTTESFATDTPVPTVVLHSFYAMFKHTNDVVWKQENGLTIASFTLGGQQKFAYYSDTNKLLVVAEPVALENLPEELQESLHYSYRRFDVAELYKMQTSTDTTYSAVLENAKRKIFVKSAGATWEELKAEKK